MLAHAPAMHDCADAPATCSHQKDRGGGRPPPGVRGFLRRRNYHREDGLLVKEDDDLMSATRIGVMAIRYAKTEGSDPRRRGVGSGVARVYNPETFWGE